jgi:hypothetical protein
VLFVHPAYRHPEERGRLRTGFFHALGADGLLGEQPPLFATSAAIVTAEFLSRTAEPHVANVRVFRSTADLPLNDGRELDLANGAGSFGQAAHASKM